MPIPAGPVGVMTFPPEYEYPKNAVALRGIGICAQQLAPNKNSVKVIAHAFRNELSSAQKPVWMQFGRELDAALPDDFRGIFGMVLSGFSQKKCCSGSIFKSESTLCDGVLTESAK